MQFLWRILYFPMLVTKLIAYFSISRWGSEFFFFFKLCINILYEFQRWLKYNL